MDSKREVKRAHRKLSVAARSIQSQCEDKHTWMSSEMAPMH